ncbi:MAG TPA: thiamine phosphate synthase [Vicinamibacterales bacterium]|nr:thiamine phosphate synthase [Vicinamibacterales bacterium]
MILCLVTDRRRLGLAVGARPQDWIEVLQQQVAGAAKAGVDLIQVREHDLDAGRLVDLVRSLIGLTANTKAKVLVNDRVDVALAARASGVHLKEASMPPAEVRRIVPPGFLIGCSVHSVEAAVARKAADFLVAGTVMPTASKSAVEYLGKDGLQRIVQVAAGQPVIGIGGLDIPSIPILAASCAAGMAAVGTLIPAAGGDVSEFVQKRVKDLRFALETASSGT